MRSAAVLLAVGIAGGAVLDLAPARAPREQDGFQVVEADLHVHTFFGDGAMSPLHLVLEARRCGLHAVAVTNHNQIATARVTRALSRALGGPTILVGEEITAPTWHLIGVGLDRKVDWRQPLVDAIADVHAQGGAAILAHPVRRFWPAITDQVLRDVDGTEVSHPAATSPRRAQQLVDVFERARARHVTAAIGSSDDHGLGTLGRYRTYVFARDLSEAAIVEAIRAGRTVVVAGGRAYGDSTLASGTPLTERASAPPIASVLVGLAGWAGAAGLLLGRARPHGDAVSASTSSKR